jgi:hypothetical protein
VTMSKMKEKKPAKKIPAPPGPEVSWEEQAAYFEKYGMEELEKAGYMRDLTASEKDELEELSELARKRVEARKSRSQLNLSFPDKELSRFMKYAERRHIPPSTLARAWILERLDEESKSAKR